MKKHTKILTRDEQIEFLREITLQSHGVKTVLARLTSSINGIYEHFDSDIGSSIGILFDGISDARETLISTLHDADSDKYKTSDDEFIDMLDAQEEAEYRNNKQFFNNVGKL